MTVYVDSIRIPATVGHITGRWSHLTADTRQELHAFAARIGLQRAWFQDKPGRDGGPSVYWHYDVTDTLRAAAITAGAQHLDLRQWGPLLAARRRHPTGEGRPPARRIQLRRTAGWRLGAYAVVVARPSFWGSPFRIGHSNDVLGLDEQVRDRAHAVLLYRELVSRWGRDWRDQVRRQLAGLDLACWCPLDQPCHGDVLLSVANPAGVLLAAWGEMRRTGADQAAGPDTVDGLTMVDELGQPGHASVLPAAAETTEGEDDA